MLHQRLFNLCRGVLFLLIITVGALTSLMILAPVVFLLPIHLVSVIKWRRYYSNLISGLYFDFVSSLIYLIGGTKVFVYSDSEAVLYDKGCLVMSNHRTRIDWMFSGWCYASLCDRNRELKMLVKESMRSVPIYGWGMQIMMYMFLRRNRQVDVPYINRSLSYLLHCATPRAALEPHASPGSSDLEPPSHVRTSGTPPSVYFFPEGTDLSPRNVERSNTFAASRGLPSWSYVLYPKAGGLHSLLSALRPPRPLTRVPSSSSSSVGDALGQGPSDRLGQRSDNSGVHSHMLSSSSSSNHIPTIQDVTIAYKDFKPGVRPVESSIFRGEFPPEIHLLVRRFPVSNVPNDEISLQLWLRDVYAYKESMLRAFYTNDSRPPLDFVDVPTLSNLPISSAGSSSSPGRGAQSRSAAASGVGKDSTGRGVGLGDAIGVRTPMRLSTPDTEESTVEPTRDNSDENQGHIKNETGNSNGGVLRDLISSKESAATVTGRPLSVGRVELESSEGSSTHRNSAQIIRKEQWPPLLKTKSLINGKALLVVTSWIGILIFGLVYSSIVRWVCTCLIALCASFRVFGGFDELELLLHADLMTQEHMPVTRVGRSRSKSGYNLNEG